MAIVEQYMDGNCKVTICDDYFYKTQEEIDAALRRISKIYAEDRYQRYLKEKAEKEPEGPQ